eukprot:c21784_g1_i2.p1 GENE.c21784_g1_i2~~c21784_g1_i2.p1  ORF type:complete len:117 (-),score=13.72 c21784_g1_i2:67-417(-)
MLEQEEKLDEMLKKLDGEDVIDYLERLADTLVDASGKCITVVTVSHGRNESFFNFYAEKKNMERAKKILEKISRYLGSESIFGVRVIEKQGIEIAYDRMDMTNETQSVYGQGSHKI